MEQWLPDFDSCRLIAINLFSIVLREFTSRAHIDYAKLYEICYIQMFLGDLIVDLEIEYVQRIIDKIKSDPESDEIKKVELDMWKKISSVAKEGRRVGAGITGLGDMLAALNLKYDSNRAIKIVDEIFKIKMQAELDCTTDLAILRGTFPICNPEKEFGVDMFAPVNDFYTFIIKEFPKQAKKMYKYGRRNISTSTVAPTGTVSMMTKTTSGIEPLFSPYYFRRRKINPNDKDNRVDFVDQNGDKWQEFAVLHPKFKDWLNITDDPFMDKDGKRLEPENMTKEHLDFMFKRSPWYQSTANDISWEKRVVIQSVIQKYTMNAISSTINLPENVSKDVVANIYWKAWKLGCKGITVNKICRFIK